MSGSRPSFWRDVLLYLPAKATPAVVSLLAIALVARSMPPAEYARYSAVVTVCLVCGNLAGGWIQQSLLYIYPSYSAQSKYLLGVVGRLQGLVAIPVLLVAGALTWYVTASPILAGLSICLLALQIAYGLLTTMQRSMRDVKEQVISVCGQSLAYLGILFAMIAFETLSAATSAVSLAVGCAVGTFLAAAQLSKSARLAGDTSIDKVAGQVIVSQIFRYGSPFCVWFIAFQLLLSCDRLVLVRYGISGAGEYASLRDLVTGLAGLTTMPLLMAAHPVIIEMWKNGGSRSEIQALVQRNVDAITMMATFAIGAALTVGPELVSAILGDRYLADRSTMVVTIVTIFAAAVAMYAHKGLEVTGQTWKMARTASCTSAASAAGFVIAAQSGGVIATAIVGCMGMMVYLFTVAWQSRDIIRLKWPRRATAQLFWLAAMGGLVAASFELQARDSHWRLFVISIVGVALYILAIGAQVRNFLVENIRNLFGPFAKRIAKCS